MSSSFLAACSKKPKPPSQPPSEDNPPIVNPLPEDPEDPEEPEEPEQPLPPDPVEPATFSVVFWDGTSVFQNFTATEGDTFVASSLGQRWPYDFIGWNAKEDGSGTHYDAGVQITLVGHLVLYAQWLYNENVRIRFDSIGETSDMPATQIIESGSVLPRPQNPVRLGYTFGGWSTETESFQEHNFDTPITEKDFRLYAHWDMEFLSLPVMSVDIQNGITLGQVDRVNYVDTKISILNAEPEHLMHEVAAEFRGRGNGSWLQSKKGYRIKFHSGQARSMFGHPSSRHWVLSAAHDTSHLRNPMALAVTNEVLDGIEYSSSVTFVELFVNGDYRGVYHLLEHVRVASNRVNIESTYDKLDTGFLIEMDLYADVTSHSYHISSNYARGSKMVEGIDFYWNHGFAVPFAISSPDPEEYTDEAFYRAQVRFIQAYTQQVFDSIFFGDWETFEKLADINSFVDKIIIHELMKDYDRGWTSFFMYKKPGGKLYCGPVWDMGSSLHESPEGFYMTRDNYVFRAIMQHPNFVNLVKQRWTAISADIATTVINTYDSVQGYADSFDRDGVRWEYSNWAEQQLFVKDWLLARIAWLDGEWSNLEPSHDFSLADQYCGQLLIWQVGAATDGAITRNFIELYNNSDDGINLAGYSIQIANSSGTNWTVVELSGVIQAKTSFLILGNMGTAHANNRLFFNESDADLLATFAISNNQYKICLVNSTVPLSIINPFNVDNAVIQGYVDMIGAINDTAIDGFAGTGPAPKMSKQQSVRRVSLENNHNNATDFTNIDYRAANTSDEVVENMRPRNQAFGVWNPTVPVVS